MMGYADPFDIIPPDIAARLQHLSREAGRDP
jgi:hypothetical protein